MPFCSSCGAAVLEKFCGKCGTLNPGFNAAGTPPPSPPPPHPPPMSGTQDLPENLACALAYAMGPLSGVLFLVLEPYSVNPKIRFHALQSLFCSGVIFVAWFVLLLISAIMLLVPIAGAILGSLLLAIFGLAVLAIWVRLMMVAYQGKTWKLPVIGGLAEKQAYSN